MDNKLSELSKPVGFIVDVAYRTISQAGADYIAARKWYVSEPLYSQEYVSALLADNEAKDKRIAELEEQNIQLKKELQNEGAANAHAYERIRGLEKRLATPVRLPEPCVYEVNGTRFYDRLSEAEVIATLREQGFTVEGDE
ncbi:TPA: hypothetical protein SMI27_004419 [Serratia liquefaciens]|nr:hypothetical protein [Serratia liquefaciens]